MYTALKTATLFGLLALLTPVVTASAPDAANPSSLEKRSGNTVNLLVSQWTTAKGDGWGGTGSYYQTIKFDGKDHTKETFDFTTYEHTGTWVKGAKKPSQKALKTYTCTIYSDPTKQGTQVLMTVEDEPYIEDAKKNNPYQVGGDVVISKVTCKEKS